MGWFRTVSTRSVKVPIRKGVRSKLNFDNLSSRIKYKTPSLSEKAHEILAWIRKRNKTYYQQFKSIEKTKAVDSFRRRHQLIEDTTVKIDAERGDISS